MQFYQENLHISKNNCNFARIFQIMVNTHLKIVTSTRLVRIPVNYIVLIEADGNYCYIYLHGKTKITVTLQLGQVIAMIKEQVPELTYIFARVGKSMVVNANYIIDIDLTSKKILLVDHKFITYDKSASRDALKQIKEQLEQREKLLEQREKLLEKREKLLEQQKQQKSL